MTCIIKAYDLYCIHRPLKIRTDGGRSRVRKLGFIGISSCFAITLSNVVRLLPNFERKLPETKLTNVDNFVTIACLLTVLLNVSLFTTCHMPNIQFIAVILFIATFPCVSNNQVLALCHFDE